MKYFSLILIFSVLIILSIILFFLYQVEFSSQAKLAEKNMDNIEKITVGMLSKDAFIIMGTPVDTMKVSKMNNELYYFYSLPFLALEHIYISIDTTNGVVMSKGTY